MSCNHDWIQANMPGYRLCALCGLEEQRPSQAPRETGKAERAKVVAFLRGLRGKNDELARAVERGDHTS